MNKDSNVIRLDNKHSLRIVIIKNPFKLWHEGHIDDFKSIFHEMIGMKLRGYGVEYPYGVLPVDTTDFFATHLLVCQESKNSNHSNALSSLTPVMGFKSTLLSDCLTHQVKFPALSLVEAGGQQSHIERIKKIMRNCETHNNKLAYTGSWTIEPNFRKNRPLTKILVELFQAMYVHYHQEENISEVITGGTVRFKADLLLGNLGHDPISLNEKTLPPIEVQHLFGEKVQVLHLKSFSQAAQSVANRYFADWNSRIELSENLVQKVSTIKRA